MGVEEKRERERKKMAIVQQKDEKRKLIEPIELHRERQRNKKKQRVKEDICIVLAGISEVLSKCNYEL